MYFLYFPSFDTLLVFSTTPLAFHTVSMLKTLNLEEMFYVLHVFVQKNPFQCFEVGHNFDSIWTMSKVLQF